MLLRLTADESNTSIGTSQRKQPRLISGEGGMVGEGAGDVSTLDDDDILSVDHEGAERDELLLVRGSTALEEEIPETELFEGADAEREMV